MIGEKTPASQVLTSGAEPSSGSQQQQQQQQQEQGGAKNKTSKTHSPQKKVKIVNYDSDPETYKREYYITDGDALNVHIYPAEIHTMVAEWTSLHWYCQTC